jgi:hypothetical protein
MARTNKTKRHFQIVLVYFDDSTKIVSVQASSYEVACRRALKRNPGAMGVAN